MTTLARKDARRHLDFPVGDKTYRVYSPPARVGLAFKELAVAGARAESSGKQIDETLDEYPDLQWLAEQTEADGIPLHVRVLGDTYAELVDDEVDSATLGLICQTVAVWVQTDSADEAAGVWNNDGITRPKAARKPQDRKPKAKK